MVLRFLIAKLTNSVIIILIYPIKLIYSLAALYIK